MSNWYGVAGEDGSPEWHYSDQGDGTLWQENGAWKFMYSTDLNESWSRHDLEPAESLDEAKRQAEKIMDRIDYLYNLRIQRQEEGVTQPDPEQTSVEIPSEDVRALLEVAETVDDMTQHERDAYDRVQRSLAEHDRELSDRLAQSLEQSLDQSLKRERNEDGMLRIPWRRSNRATNGENTDSHTPTPSVALQNGASSHADDQRKAWEEVRTQLPEWAWKTLGPRCPGGTYRSGYWQRDYTVHGVKYDAELRRLSIIEKDLPDGRVRVHSTPWRDSDVVISQPPWFVERSQHPMTQSPAHLEAKELQNDYFHAETLANTPTAWIGVGSDDPTDEDHYLDVDTETPAKALKDHLREHPELEAMEEWSGYFQEMRRDDKQPQQALEQRLKQSLEQSLDQSLKRGQHKSL